MLKHRLQILLDKERRARLIAVALERGVSVATVVWAAVDRAVPSPSDRRRVISQGLLDAPDMPVPEPAELNEELDALRARRA
jgi:hypothetical protein